MYNFLKTLFGLPDSDSQQPRTEFYQGEGNPNENIAPSDEWKEKTTLYSDQFPRSFEGNNFGFSVFNDPFGVHKFFDEFIREIQKNMDFFGFDDHPNLNWDEERRDNSFFNHGVDNEAKYSESHDMINRPTSLRNSYLKSPDDQKMVTDKRDIDLDGKVRPEDVEKIFSQRMSGMEFDSFSKHSIPKVYSKSVYIRTVRHPDGSIETIKNVRDHTGKEETTITQNHSQPTPDASCIFSGGASDTSILKKFFSF